MSDNGNTVILKMSVLDGVTITSTLASPKTADFEYDIHEATGLSLWSDILDY